MLTVVPTAVTLTPTPVEGITFSGEVATFLSPSSNIADFAASTIDWGDNTGPSGATIVPLGPTSFGQNLFAVVGTHAYGEETLGQSLPVTVTIHDAAATPVPNDTTIVSNTTVADAALTVDSGTAPVVPAGTQEGAAVTIPALATFLDQNPSEASASNFTATISWGDGSPLDHNATVTVTPSSLPIITVGGTHTYAETGSYNITVTLNDVGGSTATATSLGNAIIDAPLSNGVGVPVAGTAGQQLTVVPLGTFLDANPLATAADFTATIHWGDGTNSTGVVTLAGGSTTSAIFGISGSHVYPFGSTFPISIDVADKDGSSITISGQFASIARPSLPPPVTISTIAFPIVATEGQATPNNLPIATFTDTAGVSPFTATIAWGDGTSDVVIPQQIDSTASFQVFAPAHLYHEEGTYGITVTVNSSDGTAVANSLAVVKDTALTGITNTVPFFVVEGTTLSAVPLVTFTDANPTANLLLHPGGPTADFHAMIDWGDGTPQSAGTITFDAGTGVFSVFGTHAFPEEGNFPVTVSIADEGGSQTTATATVIVDEAPPTNLTGQTVTGTANSPLVQADLATFTTVNPLDTAGMFAATIAWGDTTTSAGTIVQDAAGVFHVQGSHTYTTANVFRPLISISEPTDSLIPPVTIPARAVISAPPPSSVLFAQGATILANEGQLVHPIVATFTDTNTSPAPSYSVTIDWGDGTAPDAGIVTVGATPVNGITITQVGTPPNIASFVVRGTHTFPEEGSFPVQVTIIRNVLVGGVVTPGSTTVATSFASIHDAALTATASQPAVVTTESPIFPVPVFGAAIFNGPVATFTDANLNAPLSDFTATIDWGDGTPQSNGTLTFDAASGVFTVSGAHTYADSGVNGGTNPFPIHVHVADEGGSVVNVTNTATVADNPINLTGILNPSSINGSSSTTNVVTSNNQPNFYGKSEPFAHVTLFANGTQVGQTQAGSDGSWSITADRLADGTYTITATAMDQFGKTLSNPLTILPNAVQGPLEINTVKVAPAVSVDRTATTFTTQFTISSAGVFVTNHGLVVDPDDPIASLTVVLTNPQDNTSTQTFEKLFLNDDPLAGTNIHLNLAQSTPTRLVFTGLDTPANYTRVLNEIEYVDSTEHPRHAQSPY